MRVLLDEQLPLDLAAMLEGHSATTVVGRGWAGVNNGDLLRRMRGEYDALLTMDQGIEFQQNLAAFLSESFSFSPRPIEWRISYHLSQGSWRRFLLSRRVSFVA